MKFLLPFMLVIPAFVNALLGQNDTLLFENFQTDPTSEMLLFPSGNDTDWVNLDEDGIVDFNNYPQNWFQALDFRYAAGLPFTADTNFVYCSSSWLFNSLNGNRNWLILPPLEIVDGQATLSWKSAPFQCPLYTDGYSVLISKTGNDPQAGNFTDTIFRAAQNKPPWPASNSLNAADYLFSPGYIHADGLTNLEYLYYNPASPDTAYTGLLEPHDFSLSAYEGSTIYIAFVHDSDDDYLISIDDILVKGTKPLSVVNQMDYFRLKAYPDPVTDILNYEFFLPEAQKISINLTDINGLEVIKILPIQKMSPGSHNIAFDFNNLQSGIYFIQIFAQNAVTSHKIVKI